jgi:outer membrane protein assembly factor BamB
MTHATLHGHGAGRSSCRKPLHFRPFSTGLRRFCCIAIAAWCWVAVGPMIPGAWAQQIIQGQFGRRVPRPGQTAEDQALDGPFQPPSHETSRHLESAKKLLEEGHYSEGLQTLDDIMQKDEDFFLRPEPGQSTHRGLKAEVQRLISQQPIEGLKAYEMLFGAKAQRILSDALAANDIEAVGQVARRYFNTKAGNDATLLVGLWDLDHNQPLAAALCLQRLHDVATATGYEPSLSVLLAFCWLHGGQEDRARGILLELKKKDSGATIQMGGKSIRLFNDESKAIAWLNDTMGKDRMPRGVESLQWAMFRGNPARNATSAGGTPLLNPHWRARTAENSSAVVSSRQSNLDRNIPIMPVAQPLAVADVVLMRTARGLLAVDFVTGKLVWQVPSTNESQAEAVTNSQRPNGLQQQGDPSLGERLWENATLGTLASDGQYVFMVEDPKPETPSTAQQQVMFRGGFGGWRGQEKVTNELAAYELRTQGKIKWKVGGSNDHRDLEGEPKLAGAYFLGPPLPLEGQLYVLAEKKEEVSLVVLDAKSGRLQWEQPLVATADSNMNGFQETFRRLSGATPSFADGVLVCPTSAGAVVAVDRATHKLLWGYEYPQGQIGPSQQQQMMNMRFAMGNGGFPPIFAGDRWADATVTLVDGRALFTPVEGEQPLSCLSLIDGKLLWKFDRGENVYVGGVQDGKVILVGKHKVQAVSLGETIPGQSKDAAPTPKVLWSLDLDPPATGDLAATSDGGKPDATKPDVAKPATVAAGESVFNAAAPRGAMPAGRGFLSGGCYFLPLSTAEVARIDIAVGKIVGRARFRKGYIPGNLICYKGDVISLGVDFLDAFYQLEPLSDQVVAALKKNPDDPIALANRAEIELDAGNLDDAIRDARLAFDKDDPRPNHSIRALSRGLLVDAMLAALRSDFNRYRVVIGELENRISSEGEQAEFLRLLAKGLQKSGDRLAAVDAYLKLADLKGGQAEPESVEPNLSVRRDRWVEARLESLYTEAPAADRAKIDDELSSRVKGIVAAKNDKELRAYINYFGFHPTANLARAELFHLLASNDTIAERQSAIERQSLLSELERSPDPVQRRAATAEMAALLKSSSRPEDAALYYRRLNTEFADQICLGGKTGKQIVADLAPVSPEARALAESNGWPSGAVKCDTGRNVQGMNFQRPVPIAWQGDRGPFFQTTTIMFDLQQQLIVGHDGMGREKFRIPLNEAGQNRLIYQQMNGPTPAFATAKGHLLFVNTGSQLLALDTLRIGAENRVLWRQELSEMAPNAFNQPTQFRQVILPWGQPKQVSQYSEATVLGIVGPITDRCVCIARSRDLIALDPLTGATLWTWHGLPPGAEVFGDNDALIVAPADGLNAIVLRTTDGQRLNTCNVPPIDHRGGYHGRRVLTWRSAEGAATGKVTILLADPWKGQDLVLGDFSTGTEAKAGVNGTPAVPAKPGMKGKIVDDESLAILEDSGRFRVLSLEDGRKLIDQQLDEEKTLGDSEKTLGDIIVEATPDQYLLVARRGAVRRAPINNRRYMPMNRQGFDTSIQLVSGSVYAFSRASGKPIWSAPALVEHEYIVLDQGQELPVILFIRPPRSDVPQAGNGEGAGSILCLDRRTGRALLEEEVPLQINNYHFSMTGDRQTNTVSLTASNHTFSLRFTDDPVPPEPPYQARLAQLKAPTGGTTTKSVLDAVHSTGGDPFGEDDDSNDGR